jgi:hypothetical protein
MAFTMKFPWSSDGPAPPPVERSATTLQRIYYLILVIAGVHLCVFIVFVVLGLRTIGYYHDHLAGPMSGPNVAHTVTNAFGIVSDVRNITHTAATATQVVSTSVGLEVPATSRHLLSASDDAVKLAVASLLNATAEKVRQFIEEDAQACRESDPVPVNNMARPGDVANLVMQRDELLRERKRLATWLSWALGYVPEKVRESYQFEQATLVLAKARSKT